MKHLIVCLIVTLSLTACRDIFQFSPHQTDVDLSMRDQTMKNIIRLSSFDPGTGVSFSFAVISDSHCYYKDLAEAVSHINAQSDIAFTIHAGDMTDLGLKEQYERSCELFKQLNKPYFTVIGNHDCLGNGQDIYQKMFGDFYYAFEYGGCAFFLFHDNVWELGNVPPDIQELDELLTALEDYQHKILVGHIPPFGDQMDYHLEKNYRDVLEKHSVSISIHGHVHEYINDPDYYNDGIPYVTADALFNRYYLKVTVTPDTITVVNVRF